MKFSSKIFKIFSNYPQTIVFFVQTRENLTDGFDFFLQIRRKDSIFAIFFRKFFQIFENSPASGPPTLNPPKFFTAYATAPNNPYPTDRGLLFAFQQTTLNPSATTLS